MYYLDLFIYHLPDLWLEASQEQEKKPQKNLYGMLYFN